jgi:diadenosine tetraphosphate (Ap4A) HIT family hydrolase
MVACRTCELTAARDSGDVEPWDLIRRFAYWDVVHAYDTSVMGWTVLVLRRHAVALAELDEDEAVELGRLIRGVSLAASSATRCAKTYVAQFAENPSHPHVHVHVIPRAADLSQDETGPRIFSQLGPPEDERLSQTAMNEAALSIRSALETVAQR